MSITDQFLVTGRTAIVTGASSGLGVTFAHVLAEAGANIVLAARRVDRMETVASELKRTGADVLVQHCDVIDSASVAAMVEAAWARRHPREQRRDRRGSRGVARTHPR